jgi:hypothetical protein
MLLEALRKQWDTRATNAPLRGMMMFEGDDLVLGASVKLATTKSEANTAEPSSLRR